MASCTSCLNSSFLRLSLIDFFASLLPSSSFSSKLWHIGNQTHWHTQQQTIQTAQQQQNRGSCTAIPVYSVHPNLAHYAAAAAATANNMNNDNNISYMLVQNQWCTKCRSALKCLKNIFLTIIPQLYSICNIKNLQQKCTYQMHRAFLCCEWMNRMNHHSCDWHRTRDAPTWRAWAEQLDTCSNTCDTSVNTGRCTQHKHAHNSH